MNIYFCKYQGTGNDFVMIDNSAGKYNDLSVEQISLLCDRKKGVGADGLIKINKVENADFEMDYYNSDGSKSFCGNGARCSVAYANELGLIQSETTFLAIDGIHKAKIINKEIELEMLPVRQIEKFQEDYLVNTGSPHYIRISEKDALDIVDLGKKIRFSEDFKTEGINVNLLIPFAENEIYVETYERGVEDETLSCGTGVTACGLVYLSLKNLEKGNVTVHTKGGDLKVYAERSSDGAFDNITLTGPAVKVFEGEIHV